MRYPFTLYKVTSKSGTIWHVRFWDGALQKYAHSRSTGIYAEGKKERRRDAEEAAKALLAEMAAAGLGTKVFVSRIRENIAVREAQARQTDLFSYAPGCNAALDYAGFIREYLGIPDLAIGVEQSASGSLFPGGAMNG
jgi:hypothetical protein